MDSAVVTVVTAFPVPESRAEVLAAFDRAIEQVHEEPGVQLYALHEGADRLVMIEKCRSSRRIRPGARAWASYEDVSHDDARAERMPEPRGTRPAKPGRGQR